MKFSDSTDAYHDLLLLALLSSNCHCACVCAECRTAVPPSFDSSGTSSDSSSTTEGFSADYQPSFSGSSWSGCFLFPLNLAAGSCAVVGHDVYHASCRLAVSGVRAKGRRRPLICTPSNTSILLAKYTRRASRVRCGLRRRWCNVIESPHTSELQPLSDSLTSFVCVRSAAIANVVSCPLSRVKPQVSRKSRRICDVTCSLNPHSG